jgi:predicted peptidase
LERRNLRPEAIKMIVQRSIPIIILMGMMVLLSAAAAAKIQAGFLNRTVQSGNSIYKYQVYVPSQWDKSRKWPVILFLHGAGERGEDGLLQTQVGIATAIRTHVDRFPCIIVMPQCRKNIWWTDPAMEAQALRALDLTVKEFKGDPDRIYLTGLSMGGYGTWSLAYKHPGRFAALVPICGGVKTPPRIPASPDNPLADPKIDPYAAVARKVGKTPVWIFHGGADTTVPVSESRKMEEALKAAGGNVRYTEYPGVGHNSWDKAYSEPEFMPWLLAQRRPR